MNKLVLIEDSHFIIDMMYARSNNMVGCAVYQEIGLGNCAFVHQDVYERLLGLIPELEKLQLKMRICDAYRPPMAHERLLQIIPCSKAKFFAETPEKSNHCHGTAIDVCLTDINGNNLAYPTEVDAYEEKFSKQVLGGFFADFDNHLVKARHDYGQASSEALENRERLRQMMESAGFEHIVHEWWHYNLKGWQNYPIINWP